MTMSFENLCASLVKAMSLTTHSESTIHPAQAVRFQVVARDRFAVECLTRWYKDHYHILGALVDLYDTDESEGVAVILRRPLCAYCRSRWEMHAPEGGKCLFGATSYKEAPYPVI